MVVERQEEVTRPRIEPERRWDITAEAEERRTHLSWGAIFGGAVVAVVTSVLLNLFGLGVGAIVLTPGQGEAAGVGIGTLIWTILSSIIALGLGGWVTGRLAGSPRTIEGVLHGLITWGVATLFTLWMITSAVGSVVGGAFGLAGQAIPGAAEQVQPQDLQGAQQEFQQRFQDQAADMAQTVGNVAGGVALGMAIMMILGAAASGLGGMLAATRRRKELHAASPLH